jgi:hypothetical protein
MIQGITSRKSSSGTRKPPFGPKMTIEEKIRDILILKRMENPQEDLRRARTYLLMDLFFRGYQNIGAWNDALGWASYDAEPLDYQENRFRRNVLINAGGLIRSEPMPVIRPASGNIQDLEAAVTGQDAWEKAKDEICYDRLLAEKSMLKPLFGNAFIFSGYQTSRRFGTMLVPKMSFDEVEIPGGAICPACAAMGDYGETLCPECGSLMEQQEPMMIEMPKQTGTEERLRGQLFSTAFSPLEIKVRSKIKGGLVNAPYLLRLWREDVELLEYAFQGEDFGSDAVTQDDGASSDVLMRYQQLLSSVTGNPDGSRGPLWTTTQGYGQKDVIMGWLTPQTFRGDAELEREFPDGVMGVLVGTKLVEAKKERLTDFWTHEVYLPSPHSFYGDGMYDDIPIQRSINKIGQLTERHLEYDTIPLRLYETGMISPKDVSNDSALKWIEVQTTFERGLDKAVRELPAQNLSWDVNQLYSSRLQADQDISGATDPMGGKIAGANTPYSAQLLAVEQGQTRFLPTASYNRDAVGEHVRQVLQLAQTNWIEPRQLAEIDQNTGRSTWKQFQGTDLSRGNWNVYVAKTDFKPKTRGEMMQALDVAKNYGIDVLATPKMRLNFFEKVGLDPSGDMLSTQARRAGRIIEWYRQGKPYSPNPLVDDGMIQADVILEFLASPQGDDLQETSPLSHEGLVSYVETVLNIAAMKAQAFGAMGIGGPQAMPQGGPQQGPGPQKQEFAQSNQVPDGQKAPMPQSPARQQQGAGVLPE